MVLNNPKAKVRHKKPSNRNIHDILEYLYSLGIYRDWVQKQKSEEGINRQAQITEKEIESEANRIAVTRCSKRVYQSTENDNCKEEKAGTVNEDIKKNNEEIIYERDEFNEGGDDTVMINDLTIEDI